MSWLEDALADGVVLEIWRADRGYACVATRDHESRGSHGEGSTPRAAAEDAMKGLGSVAKCDAAVAVGPEIQGPANRAEDVDMGRVLAMRREGKGWRAIAAELSAPLGRLYAMGRAAERDAVE